MTETSARTRDSGRANPKGAGGSRLSRLWQSFVRYIKQILDELSKVVRPTRSELVNYTAVVIVFVVIIMAIVAGLDLAFQKLIVLIFSKG